MVFPIMAPQRAVINYTTCGNQSDREIATRSNPDPHVTKEREGQNNPRRRVGENTRLFHSSPGGCTISVETEDHSGGVAGEQQRKSAEKTPSVVSASSVLSSLVMYGFGYHRLRGVHRHIGYDRVAHAPVQLEALSGGL